MSPHCEQWKVYADVPLQPRIVDDESLADGEVAQACLDCGMKATVYYRLD